MRKAHKSVCRRAKIVRTAGFFVYMLQCADRTLYTGYTKDIKARVRLHNSGRGSKYVRARLPARLVYCKPYHYYKHAVKEELRIKSLLRSEKEALIKAYRFAKRKKRLYCRKK